MDFFSKLTKVATATLSDAMRSVNEVMSQEQFGDPTGKRAIYEGLDVTYLSPRLIGEEGAWLLRYMCVGAEQCPGRAADSVSRSRMAAPGWIVGGVGLSTHCAPPTTPFPSHGLPKHARHAHLLAQRRGGLLHAAQGTP